MTSAVNDTISSISSSYTPRVTESEDPLGRDAFLTMLVAQLQNQDPLNPMDGTDFTAQLAQYSQLEAAFNTNDILTEIQASLSSSSEPDAQSYIGKGILAEVAAIDVTNGEAFGGYYSLESMANVMVTIENEYGEVVRTLYPGQQEAGSYEVDWDATDDDGNPVLDGDYTYHVFADSGYGYEQVVTTVSGTVEGVLFSNGKSYLQVNDTFVDPDSVLKVWLADESTTQNPMEYLGRTVTADRPAIVFENGQITGAEPDFGIDIDDEVMIRIFDASGQMVKSYSLGELSSGSHSLGWDGTDSSGATVSSGIYSFEVLTTKAYSDLSVQGEVEGVMNIFGGTYLKIGDAYVSPGSVTAVQ